MMTFLLLFFSQSFAKTLTEDFSTRTYLASSTLVWNQALGELHPTAEVQNIQVNFVAQANQSLDLGDGSHGAFNLATAANFATSVDSGLQIIYFNNTAYPILKVTTFDLPAGWTLVPVGNGPLKIFAMGDVNINGTIDCSGGNGTAAVGASPGIGGSARCGGGAGGNGGSVGGNGANGSSPNGGITAGGGGTFGGANGAGGGGGGSFSDSSGALAAGGNGSGVGGTGGNFSGADQLFLIETGGAGGGGGSGGAAVAGSGGGAGGGFIEIHSGRDITIGLAGKVLANGGNGGSGAAGVGPGGAGGGGSIKVWAVGNVTVNNNVDTYALMADTGTAGTVGGVSGGTAQFGRTWIDLGNFLFPGGATYYPNESAQLTSIGNVRFATAAEQLITGIYDVRSTMPVATSFDTAPTSADWTLEVAGSNDSFVSDDTGWQPVASISVLDGKRFVRFRLTLTNSNAITPTRATSMSYIFAANLQDQFPLKSAGCGTLTGSQSRTLDPNQLALIFAALLFPMGFLIFLKFHLFHRPV